MIPVLAIASWLAFCGTGPDDTWLDLIGKEGLEQWKEPAGDWVAAGDVTLQDGNDRKLVWKPGNSVVVNGERGRTRNLFTRIDHADVEAHIEFTVSKGSNSGVYFMGRYEIQILDSWGKKKVGHGDCGGIYQRWDSKRGRGKQGFEGRGPRVNASKPPGEWQTFDVIFRGPRFDADGKKTENARFVKVFHNGRVVHENVEVTGPTRASAWNDEKPRGPMMLQGDHGPVAFRNIRIRHLEPEGK